MVKGTITDWYVKEHASHISVVGKLYVNGLCVFLHFDTYNPTTIDLDESHCRVSTGNVYRLENKREQ